MNLEWKPEAQRCAIYTRKSVALGLDLEFNSLQTQRAICSAYITSQQHKGWREIATHYDDGGRSGATLDRPELHNLLTDVEHAGCFTQGGSMSDGQLMSVMGGKQTLDN